MTTRDKGQAALAWGGGDEFYGGAPPKEGEGDRGTMYIGKGRTRKRPYFENPEFFCFWLHKYENNIGLEVISLSNFLWGEYA